MLIVPSAGITCLDYDTCAVCSDFVAPRNVLLIKPDILQNSLNTRRLAPTMVSECVSGSHKHCQRPHQLSHNHAMRAFRHYRSLLTRSEMRHINQRFSYLYFILFFSKMCRGVATGVYIGIYTPKISPKNFLWGKNDVRTAIQQFYTPLQKNFYTPKNKFLATPLKMCHPSWAYIDEVDFPVQGRSGQMLSILPIPAP